MDCSGSVQIGKNHGLIIIARDPPAPQSMGECLIDSNPLSNNGVYFRQVKSGHIFRMSNTERDAIIIQLSAVSHPSRLLAPKRHSRELGNY